MIKNDNSYNGYKSWNNWNVAFWIDNSPSLYFVAQKIMKKANNNPHAASELYKNWLGIRTKTPDGAYYTHQALHEAFERWVEEHVG